MGRFFYLIFSILFLLPDLSLVVARHGGKPDHPITDDTKLGESPEMSQQPNVKVSSGASGSARGPNSEYTWGWGSGPAIGWGYGSGSACTPGGGSARGSGFGVGIGAGSGSGSGSGYSYGPGGEVRAGGSGSGSGGGSGSSVESVKTHGTGKQSQGCREGNHHV
ncbi:hypothetical protein LINGRAHAP2_LOCUS29449 [Linum grandiflorum]